MKKLYLVMGNIDYYGSDVLRIYENKAQADECAEKFKKERVIDGYAEIDVYDDFEVIEKELS
jgi:hypothetical protein